MKIVTVFRVADHMPTSKYILGGNSLYMNEWHLDEEKESGEDVVDRIYHEDSLLADRNFGYMSVNAFLFVGYVTALVFIQKIGLELSIIQLSAIILGIFLGIFHISIGKRTEFAISFTRALERSGLKKAKDRYLFEFYRDGMVITKNAFITTKSVSKKNRTKKGTMYGSIPWRWKFVGSVNNVVGVIIPFGIVLFWISVSFTVQTGLAPIQIHGLEIAFNDVIGISTFVVTMAFLFGMRLSWPKDPQEFRSNDTILAVLGRGIQFQQERWVLTPDIETYRLKNGKPEHSAVPLTPGTESTADLVGGGLLNVEAAALFLNRTPMLTLVGYAPPADYLIKWDGTNDGPSEGKIMGERLKELVPNAKIIEWNQNGLHLSALKKSNTELEVRNIVHFADSNGFHKILFLTVSAHMKRVRLIASKYFEGSFDIISSEDILTLLDPGQKSRIGTSLKLEADKRTIGYEKIGIKKIKRER